jgi:dynein heavy chain
MLTQQLRELNKTIAQGFDPINWNSLHIPAYIEKCNKAIDLFQAMQELIHSSTSKIEERLASIANTRLVSEADFDDVSYQISDLTDQVEMRCRKRVADLVNKCVHYVPRTRTGGWIRGVGCWLVRGVRVLE